MKKLICVLLVLVLSSMGSMEIHAAYLGEDTHSAEISNRNSGGRSGEDANQKPEDDPNQKPGDDENQKPGDDENQKPGDNTGDNSDNSPVDRPDNKPPVSTESPIRVLMVGNSFTKYKPYNVTYSVEKPLEELAAWEGHNLDVKTVSHGGAWLSYYAGMQSEYLSYHKELMVQLLNEKWDYIVIQEQSKSLVEQFDTRTYPAVERILRMIKTYQPQATPLLYMTHGYSDNSLTKVNGVPTMLTAGELELYVAAACKSLEVRLGIEAVPVGMHYNRAHILYPWIRMVGPDFKHPTYAGYYLAACSFYYRIFKSIPDPRKATLSDCDIGEREQVLLASLVSGSIRMSTGSITLNPNESTKVTALSGYSPVSSVTYRSLNTDVVSVNPATGAIRAKQGGTTSVAAITPDGLQAFCDITVRIPLSFPREWYLASKGDRLQIQPDTNAKDLKWTSSRTKVAAIDSATGMVTAKTSGRAVITVRNKEDANDKASYYLYVTCDTPTGLKASSVDTSADKDTYGSIKLTWKATSDASSYAIYRSTKKNGSYTLIGTSKKPTYTDKKAKVNQCYYYKIAARNSYPQCGSKLSDSVRGVILKAPTLKGSSTSKGYAKLTWNKNKNASGYIIYASARKDSGYKKIIKLTSASRKSYTDKYLKKKKRHYYRIRAFKVLDGKTFYGMKSKTLEIPYTAS